MAIIVPYHIYIAATSAYCGSLVLVCKENTNEQLALDATEDDIHSSQSKVFIRRGRFTSRFKGRETFYTKIHIDNLEFDYTIDIIHRNAVARIERYWAKYRERRKQHDAINTLKPFILHWAYKPDGVLGRRTIMSLCRFA